MPVDMEQHTYLVGLSHRTAAVDVRERFALTAHCTSETWAIPLGRSFTASGELIADVEEVLILSTCNRVELLAVGRGAVPEALMNAWALACRCTRGDLAPHVYVYQDQKAIEHVFSVACSLDSMVLGEPQILGQLKDAYRKAADAKTTGHILNRMLHKAFSVAKRVRSQTGIASSAVSISYAAVELAKRIFGDMHGRCAMLIGAGEMAELAATHLVNAGVSKVLVANRTLAHGIELAKQFNGEAVPFEGLFARLHEADIVISSTGATEAVVTADDVLGVLAQRKNSPIFFIDIAVPRDIDPAVNTLDNVYLYDIDDLQEVVEENLEHRRGEATKAHVLVAAEVDAFCLWLHSLSLQPMIMALLEHFDGVAQTELEKTLKRLGHVSPETEQALQIMMHAIVAKLAHAPLSFLKEAHTKGQIQQLGLVQNLFHLEKTNDV